MTLGIVSKIILGLAFIIIATIILIYMKAYVKNLENENINKKEITINGRRGVVAHEPSQSK
jgi:membrane protein implicated in regulation of membrane protease activity